MHVWFYSYLRTTFSIHQRHGSCPVQTRQIYYNSDFFLQSSPNTPSTNDQLHVNCPQLSFIHLFLRRLSNIKARWSTNRSSVVCQNEKFTLRIGKWQKWKQWCQSKSTDQNLLSAADQQLEMSMVYAYIFPFVVYIFVPHSGFICLYNVYSNHKYNDSVFMYSVIFVIIIIISLSVHIIYVMYKYNCWTMGMVMVNAYINELFSHLPLFIPHSFSLNVYF